jgi:formylglycine-generating enzyme required for sulfatase activity
MKKLFATIIITLIAATPLFAQEPHPVDLNGDFVISRDELQPVIELWKAGAYHIDSNGKFVPGDGKDIFTVSLSNLPEDANSDFVISHEEMLRVVEMWKSGAYHIDSNGNFVPGNGNATFTVNLPNLPTDATPLDMVLIKAGTFKMGSPSTEKGHDNNEQQHVVTITKEFYIGKYEVTQAQWQSVRGSNPSYFSGNPDNPVERVSWNDCQEFITKLNQTGQGTFRLPTEAEWEYACRAGTTERYYWGDDPDYSFIKEYAWYSGNNSPYGTKEVGTRLPNRWGLFDMSGNVWEWCQDWYGPYPTPPNPGVYRVLRGGSGHSYSSICRSANRSWNDPNNRHYNSGFRLCRTP